MKAWLLSFYEDARDWTHGRMWIPRLVMWLYLAWAFFHFLGDSRYTGIVGGLNLGIHELGHFVFRPLGEFMMFLGGSLFQNLVPFSSLFMFYKQRDFFAITVGFGWLSTNLFGVATYIADARSMSLPLVTPGGGDAQHDWNYLLGRMGLLAWDQRFAFLTRVAATISMLICLVAGAWLLWLMFCNRNKARLGEIE